MDNLFETIRSLQTDFVVAHCADEEIVLAVRAVEITGVIGPANLRFSRPRGAWAARWDSVRCEWRDAPELSMPSHGWIREAHIKPIPVGISVSFSDKQDPLTRWGFTANGLTVESGTGLSRAGA